MPIHRPIQTTTGDIFFQTNLPIYVNRVNESFEIEEHKHDFYEISYISEGAGVHYIQGETMPVVKGDLFFIPIGVSHVFRPMSVNKERPLVVFNCIFTRVFFQKLLLSIPFDSKMIAFFGIEEVELPPSWKQFKDLNGECNQLFLHLHREFLSQKWGFVISLYASLTELLLFMVRFEENTGSTRLSMTAQMHELLAYMDRYCHLPFTLTDLSNRTGFSTRQLQRLIKSYTGMTFIDYIQSRRMEQCCFLLRTTRNKISEIATESGYQDIKFFNQLFKKKTGMTPREYRSRR